MPFDASSSHEGSSDFADFHSSSSATLALIDTSTGRRIKTIEERANPGSQAFGAFSGDHAVWKETHIAGDVDDFVVNAWDSATGRVSHVGGSHKDEAGRAIPSTWQAPVIAGNRAAWVEGLDSQGAGEIVVLDLTTDRRTIVRRGHPGWLAITGDSLVWAESSQPGAATALHALDLNTRKETALPAPLAGVSGAWAFSTDGTWWAWIAGTTPTLYAGKAGGSTVEIAAIPQGGGSPPIAILDGIATVAVSAGGLMVANLNSSAWTYLSHATFANRVGSDLLVGQLSGTKVAGDALGFARLPASAFGELTCP